MDITHVTGYWLMLLWERVLFTADELEYHLHGYLYIG